MNATLAPELYRTRQTLTVNPLDKSGSTTLTDDGLFETYAEAREHIAEMSKIYGQPIVAQFHGHSGMIEKLTWTTETLTHRCTDTYWVCHPSY